VTAQVSEAAGLAVIAGLCFGLAAVFLRRGLQHATPLAGALFSVIITAVIVWSITAATVPLSRALTPAVLPFLAAGLLAPGLARLVMFVGIQRIGAARTAPLVAVSPLFAIGGATIALGERPPPLLLAGAAAVVGGAMLLASPGRPGAAWRRRDMAFPLLAALGFALRDTISRWGLLAFPEPLIAAAAATLMSVLVMWLCAGGARLVELARGHPAGLVYFVAAGCCEGLASITMWRALAAGGVAVVSPLVNASPLVTILLAAVFLRDLERVTWRLALGGTMIVAGAALVIYGGASTVPP
jgi:drug/metabolite transporter (DMT)-like permease